MTPAKDGAKKGKGGSNFASWHFFWMAVIVVFAFQQCILDSSSSFGQAFLPPKVRRLVETRATPRPLLFVANAPNNQEEKEDHPLKINEDNITRDDETWHILDKRDQYDGNKAMTRKSELASSAVARSTRSSNTTTNSSNTTQEYNGKNDTAASQRAEGGILSRIGERLSTLLSTNKEEDMEKSIAQTILEIMQMEEEDTTDTKPTFQISYLLKMIHQHWDTIASVFDEYLEPVDFSSVTPIALFYYLEYEDERKNPSWKRRQHLFCENVDGSETERLFEYLCLAKLSYLDTPEEIQTGLDAFQNTSYDLVYAQTQSEPGTPAHFLALNEQDSNHLLISVRGTKSIADAITDLSCSLEDYRSGKAHSFVLKSGRYLFDTHLPFIQKLQKMRPDQPLRVTLVGHSLGAAAATILGMELQDIQDIHVEVIGFGCPPAVSHDLAVESSDYITTVVADADMVARTSAVTVRNLLWEVSNFDWTPRAKKDIEEYLEIFRSNEFILSETVSRALESALNSFLDEELQSIQINANKTQVELYPPGKIVHYYYDGHRISARCTPNSLFHEIDVSRRMLEDHLIHGGYGKMMIEHARQENDNFNALFETGLDDIVL